MTVLLRTTNINYTPITSIVIESLYRNDVSSTHSFKLINGDSAINGVNITPYALDSDDINDAFESASTDSYQYLTISDDNITFLSSLTENFTPLEEKTIYVKATIPSEPIIGTWECGIKGNYDDGTSNIPLTGWEDWKHYAILPVIGGDEEFNNWYVELTVGYVIGAMQTDFGDIRFALSDGTTLDYEITENSLEEEATFKIEVPTVPSSTTTLIYVLYGNGNVTTTSTTISGTNPEVSSGFTPVWNDNFSDDSIDTSKWTSSTPVGSITESSGTMNISISSGVNADWWGGSIENAPIIYAGVPTGDFEAKVKISSYTPAAYKHVGMILYKDRDNAYIFGQSNTTIYLEKIVDDSGSDISGVSNSTIPLWLKISYIDGVITFSYSTDDSTYTTYTSFTSEFTPEYVGLVAKNWQTYPSVDVSFDDFEVYDAYELAQPSTGSLGSTQLNGHVYEKDLTIWGKVLGEHPEDPPSNEQPIVVSIDDDTLALTTGGMTDFEISKRYNDKAASFTFNYRTGIDIGIFLSGQKIELDFISDSGTKRGLIGTIDNVNHQLQPANKTYSIDGKDIASQLSDEDYSKEGNVFGVIPGLGITWVDYKFTDIINEILEGTDIIPGPGCDNSLTFGNHAHLDDYDTTYGWFFGYFKTKKIALDFLCYHSSKITGNTYRWFVDSDGVLNIFIIEDIESQASITITNDNPRLVSINLKDSASNVMNKQTGYYGTDENNSVTLQDDYSIDGFIDENGTEWPGLGVKKGDDLHESSYSYDDMVSEIQDNLGRLSPRIFTLDIIMKRFIDVDVGQPLYADFTPVQNMVFIVSDVTIKGEVAKDITHISATTDSNVFSEEEEVEIMQIVAKDTINDNSASVGTVTDVSGSAVVATTWGDNGSISAKDINS